MKSHKNLDIISKTNIEKVVKEFRKTNPSQDLIHYLSNKNIELLFKDYSFNLKC